MKDHLINKIFLLVGIIAVLGVASSSVVIASPAYAQAQPTHVIIEKFNQSDVPPGLTRVTIIHGIDGTRTEIDHGPGVVPPPKKQESFQCTSGANTDQCDTNSFNGKKWFSLPLPYSVNLEDANDDENFLAAVNAGIQTWEDDPNSSFDAEFLGETGKISSTAEPRARMDGSNVIDWGSTKHFGGTVIAVVVFFYFTSTGEMVEADMRFNEDLSWSSNGGPGAISDPDSTTGLSGFFDVQNIATHEGGHYVSGLKDLKDSTERELTMYGFGSTGELKKRTLGLGDQLSIATAYPGTTPPAPTNDPPVAVDDADTVLEGGMVTTTVLANDSDDGTLDPLTVTVVGTPPVNGIAVANADGTITYTHDGSETTSDSYTYTVDDDDGATSNVATVSITVTPFNDPPTAVDDTASVAKGGTVNINVASNDNDPDDGLNLASIVVTSGVSNGALTVNTDGTVDYTHNGGETSSDSFTYTIKDVSGQTSNAATVTITVNDPSAGVSVVSISPNSIERCKCTIPMTITGSGFSPNVAITITGGDGPTPKVSNITVSDVQVTFDATLKSGGPSGLSIWTVTVTNTVDGTSDSILLEITKS